MNSRYERKEGKKKEKERIRKGLDVPGKSWSINQSKRESALFNGSVRVLGMKNSQTTDGFRIESQNGTQK